MVALFQYGKQNKKKVLFENNEIKILYIYINYIIKFSKANQQRFLKNSLFSMQQAQNIPILTGHLCAFLYQINIATGPFCLQAQG